MSYSKTFNANQLNEYIGYYKDKECTILHKEDGPAYQSRGGYDVWYKDGKIHRDDGPAIEHEDGYKEWLINGILHRSDGPAVELANGIKIYYLNGIQYSEKEYWAIIKFGAFV